MSSLMLVSMVSMSLSGVCVMFYVNYKAIDRVKQLSGQLINAVKSVREHQAYSEKSIAGLAKDIDICDKTGFVRFQKLTVLHDAHRGDLNKIQLSVSGISKEISLLHSTLSHSTKINYVGMDTTEGKPKIKPKPTKKD